MANTNLNNAGEITEIGKTEPVDVAKPAGPKAGQCGNLMALIRGEKSANDHDYIDHKIVEKSSNKGAAPASVPRRSPVPLVPAISLAAEVFLKQKSITTLKQASSMFNVLVANSREFSPQKLGPRRNFPSKFVPISALGAAARAIAYGPCDISGPRDICYVTAGKEMFFLEEIIDHSCKSSMPDKAVRQAFFDQIHPLFKKACLTAFGAKPKVNVVQSDAKLEELKNALDSYDGPVILDIETGGLDPYTSPIVGIGISLDASEGWYVPTQRVISEYNSVFSKQGVGSSSICSAEAVNAFVKNTLAKKKIVAHNAKFEYQFFKTNFGVSLNIFHDTMVGEYILDCRLKGRFSLGKSVAERFPLIEEWKESQAFFENITKIPIIKVADYCVRDCCNEYLLLMAQYAPLCRDMRYLTWQVDIPFIQIAAEAELEGFSLDVPYLVNLHDELMQKVSSIGDSLVKIMGPINLDSSAQLREVLFGKMGFKPIKTTSTGQASVDADSLEMLRNSTKSEVFDLLLERRACQKLAATYTLSFVEKRNTATAKIHPSFMLTDTETGRLSSKNPNFQNLPKRASDLIRRAIIAPDGYTMIFADYSGQEVRILAALSRDKQLLRAYNPCYECPYLHTKHKCPKITPSIGTPDYCRPMDIHSLVASKIFRDIIGDTPIWEIEKKFKRERTIAKSTTFLLCYGGAEPTLAHKTGISIDEAKAVFEMYFKEFSSVKPWIQKMYNFALSHGYSQDVLGRRRYYEILDPNQELGSESCPFYKTPYANEDLRVLGLKKGAEYHKEVMAALRKAQNHPVQGSAAEMTKQGSIAAATRFKTLPFRARIAGFVHDEIISLVPKNKDYILCAVEQIKAAMTEDIPLIEKYTFPECLHMEVGISCGDNWGETMDVAEYLDTF